MGELWKKNFYQVALFIPQRWLSECDCVQLLCLKRWKIYPSPTGGPGPVQVFGEESLPLPHYCARLAINELKKKY